MDIKAKLLTGVLLAASSLMAGPRVFIGIGGGGYGYYPPPPPPIVAYAPRPYYPGPGYSWINGYYYTAGPRYAWRPGYWARPPYAGARWYGPRYYGGRYYNGYWRR